MIAKCGECGKEYQLEEGEKVSDFQCECGGILRYDNEGYTPNLPLILIATALLTIIGIFTSGFIAIILIIIILAVVGAQSYQVNNGVFDAILTGAISFCIGVLISEGLFSENILFIVIGSIIIGAIYGAIFGVIGRILMRYIKRKKS